MEELPPKKPRSPLLIIFLTIFIDMIGFGMIIPILPLYGKHFQASEWQIGCLAAVYSAVQLFAGPVLGSWSDRVGRRPVLLFSLLGTALGFFMMGSATTLAMLFFARALDGFTGGNISTAQAYIADVTTPENRAKGMGMIGAAFGLGFAFGPALGGLLSQHDLHLGSFFVPAVSVPFYFAGFLALANALAVYWRLPESLPRERIGVVRPKMSKRQMWQEAGSPILGKILLISFVSIVGFSIMTTIFALFTERHFGFTTAGNGYTFALIGIIGVIIQGGLIGRLTRKFGERRLATAGAGILAIGLFLIPVGHALSLFFLASGLIAVGNSLMTPTLNALASRSTGPAHQGSVLGLMASAGSLGRTIGPVLGGSLLAMNATFHYGQTAYWTAAALLLVSMALTFLIQPGALLPRRTAAVAA